jgi:hypothetical protein
MRQRDSEDIVPGVGIEPTQPFYWLTDFKSVVYTNFTTQACIEKGREGGVGRDRTGA